MAKNILCINLTQIQSAREAIPLLSVYCCNPALICSVHTWYPALDR